MDTEVPLSLQETQMDEFESSKVLARKPVQRNVIKFLKVGIVVLFSLLIIGGGAYAFVTSTQKEASGFYTIGRYCS